MNINEYLLSINSFNKPKILTGKDTVYVLFVRLILLEPGTIQSHPDMGVGIISRYRYSDTSDLDKLKNDITDQINTYLPDFAGSYVTVTENTKQNAITIKITAENTTYTINFNTTTKSISDL